MVRWQHSIRFGRGFGRGAEPDAWIDPIFVWNCPERVQVHGVQWADEEAGEYAVAVKDGALPVVLQVRTARVRIIAPGCPFDHLILIDPPEPLVVADVLREIDEAMPEESA